jgi:alpha-L-fucosidase 2
MKRNLLFYTLIFSVTLFFSCNLKEDLQESKNLKLWYQAPAQNWNEAFPLGNGRLAAMCFGGTKTERYQINEESLWAGSPINPIPDNFYENLKKIQKMVLDGDVGKAWDFGLENLTVMPTSFRSYEPFADLTIGFDDNKPVQNYTRELNMATGVCKVEYKTGETKILRESFISAVDDVLCIKLSSTNRKKISCTIGLQRFKDATVLAFPDGRINMDGQIIDLDGPDDYDDNPGGSGPGGKHMSFSGRLIAKTEEGTIKSSGNSLRIESATEIVLLFTAATDYNLALMNFDPTINTSENASKILDNAGKKSWAQLKTAHTKEHSEMFNRVSLDLGTSPNDTLPTDKRIEAFQTGAEDNGLMVQLFQFGRYLLMSSSRSPAILPANLQGKWSEKEWAPWEADYHMNINLQMNYWPSDVTNLSETNAPLVNWFERLTETSKPVAKEMYHAEGWFSGHASNPFGRVTPSASTPRSQFANGVLDPLAGTWMVMNLWDHYEYTQDQAFLKDRLYPMLKGASEFILDVLVPDSEGVLQFVPSESPENLYVDPPTGRMLRITATSTYHLSIIKAVFKATLEASEILDIRNSIYEEIKTADNLLPKFPVSNDGLLKEWQSNVNEHEPGHRHLSPFLAVHPFGMITERTPDLFEAAHKSFTWRKKNQQGSGGGWSAAHSSIMYTRFHEGDKAYSGLKTILNSFEGTSLLNARRMFQIDANFGATSCIAEMLIQSHLKDENGNFILQLLPAIPSEWPTGNVKGLCARGGFEVDMKWEEGRIIAATISSVKGGTCKVQFKDIILSLTLNPGEERTLTELY